ncbi:MAG: ATP/GTP-binding protein [Rhodospirillales bacterium]|nr:ATP/GTP-binding protein [Rhodospirillales bacterium]
MNAIEALDRVGDLKQGGKAAVAAALAQLEVRPEAEASLALLGQAWQLGRAGGGQVLGITGPPGVGKSTLTGALLKAARASGRRVAVLAIDPSSRRSGGALLGDRLRVMSPAGDRDCFVRSMAARSRLGGLADEAFPAITLLRALYDLVLVETVGVGQSETDVADMADTVIFCVQPASGDAVQFMKAGIVEIPHIAVVTKADLGAAAERALADLKAAVGLSPPLDGWSVACIALAAQQTGAAGRLLALADSHLAHLKERDALAAQRASQGRQWLRQAILADYGRQGLEKLGPLPASMGSPFAALAGLRGRLGCGVEPGA